jgi:hypothetical protein
MPVVGAGYSIPLRSALSLGVSAYRAEGDTTYAGPEVTLNLFHVEASLGYTWPLSGRGTAGILVFGLGVGL